MKDIRQNWKAAAALRSITCNDIAALCIYRSVRSEDTAEAAISRLLKSFTPVSNPVKLANGAQPYASLRLAIYGIKGSKLYHWLDKEEQDRIAAFATSLAPLLRTL